jgi:hypothetical protein
VRLVRLATALLLAAAPPAASQQFPTLPNRPLRVQSCPDADSLLGALGDDRGAHVRGLYAPDRDATYLTTAQSPVAARSAYYFEGNIWYLGSASLAPTDSVGWGAALPAVTLWLRGQAARVLLDASPVPIARLIVDDTDTTATGTVGRYIGPPELTVAPVQFPLTYESFLQVLRAQRVAVRVGSQTYAMSKNERRDFRGVFRVAVCTGAR